MTSIQDIVKTATAIEIISGEGTGEGHSGGVITARSVSHLAALMRRERCNGDRWAFARVVCPDGAVFKIRSTTDIGQIA
jgi:hypothetical protein